MKSKHYPCAIPRLFARSQSGLNTLNDGHLVGRRSVDGQARPTLPSEHPFRHHAGQVALYIGSGMRRRVPGEEAPATGELVIR